jgi:hypothetical protein
MRKEEKKKIRRISNILSILSLVFLIIPTIILWVVIGKTSIIIFITILVGVIALIDVSIFITNRYSKKKLLESIPLMKHRMNKFLTHSSFYFGVGLPLFFDAWIRGFKENPAQLIISIIILFAGILIYDIGYLRRDKLIEEKLIKQKMNKK